MNLASLILSRFRLTLTGVLLLAIVGAVSWLTMPRQEDPTLPYRAANVVIPYPGADAETVERLVAEPLEDALAQIEEIDTMRVTSRANVAVAVFELREDVLEGIDRVWDEVEDKIEDARSDFPDTVGEPIFDRDIFDVESIVVAVNGGSAMDRRQAALDLEKALLRLPTVSRVILSADPGEQVTVAIDTATARRLGLDARTIAAQLRARNAAIPGGTVVAGGRTLTVRPNAEFRTIDEIRATPILLQSGAAVPLASLADVRLGPVEPRTEFMLQNGAPSISVGVVPRRGINVLNFGDQVASAVDAEAAAHTALRYDYMAFQPQRVEARLSELGGSLLTGILIVALVVVLFMGFRLGITVASIVPLVAMAALAIYAMFGGVLQQMSIAALVLALGLLVDNAIVVAENVQSRIDAGEERWAAARAAIEELALPLGAATGTTLAAFVPMLLSVGTTGDFTRALPIVIMVTLSVSYVVAITVTPALSAIVLRPKSSAGPARAARFRGLAELPVRQPLLVLLAVAGALAASISLVPRVGLQFFPASDRNQLLVDLTLPEGTHVSESLAAAEAMNAWLLERDDVTQVTAFAGRGLPHFYYNVVQRPSRPHLSQLLITTRDAGVVDELIGDLREQAPELVPGVEVIPQRIEQGPPIAAPIELRLYGEDLGDLHVASERLMAAVRALPGTVDVRNTMGQGAPSLSFEVHDATAARYGLSREDLAVALLSQTRGIDVGEYRGSDDPMPIRVRGTEGEHTPVDVLTGVDVSRPGSAPIPAQQLSTASVEWAPAAIGRRNRSRTVSVLAQLESGATFSAAMGELDLESLDLPEGITIEVGGEAEGSGEANTALLTTLPIGMMLLLLFLMGEFNSFRAVGIVMSTVPLAAVGVIPGLVFGGQPFGFMSMLGVFALIGIVVNNAIVLIDVIQRRRSEGNTIADAIRDAVAVRTRPILLTTATTVAGLMPLALSESTFWPPLASSMISGLLASTFLTLFAVPALYRLLFRDR